MSSVRAEASAEIGAPPDRLYSILADYRQGHPRILPPRWFTGLEVEEGGVGAGTVIRFGMKTLGRGRWSRARITEPEPGRRLVETVLDDPRDLVTTFVVEPLAPDRARVTIGTEWTARGVAGVVERLLAPSLLRRIYVEELSLLENVARASR